MTSHAGLGAPLRRRALPGIAAILSAAFMATPAAAQTRTVRVLSAKP